MKKPTYEERLTDWVLQYGTEPSSTDAQFSAEQVADLIIKFNRDRLAGKIKL